MPPGLPQHKPCSKLQARARRTLHHPSPYHQCRLQMGLSHPQTMSQSSTSMRPPTSGIRLLGRMISKQPPQRLRTPCCQLWQTLQQPLLLNPSSQTALAMLQLPVPLAAPQTFHSLTASARQGGQAAAGQQCRPAAAMSSPSSSRLCITGLASKRPGMLTTSPSMTDRAALCGQS